MSSEEIRCAKAVFRVGGTVWWFGIAWTFGWKTIQAYALEHARSDFILVPVLARAWPSFVQGLTYH